MFRSFLSWRYLLARRTNLIGITGIAVGVMALVLILSIMSGFLEEGRRAVRGTLADVLVMPGQSILQDPQSPGRTPEVLLEAVLADPRVASASAQLLWAGVIVEAGDMDLERLPVANNGDYLQVGLVGIDVDPGRTEFEDVNPSSGVPDGKPLLHDEFSTTSMQAALRGNLRGPCTAPVENALDPFAAPPNYAPEGRRRASVIVGNQLFETLGLSVGETLQVGTQVQNPVNGAWVINNRSFVVAGSFRTGDNESDLGKLYFDRRELADFLGDSQSYSQVCLRLHDYGRDGEALVDDLSRKLPELKLVELGYLDLQIQTWENFRITTLGAIENERNLMAIMLSLILMVAGFTVFAILTMMVAEKRRDIGILRSLGATSGGVLKLFLMIAFWDALLGSLIGSVLGILAALKIDAIEAALSSGLGVEIINREVYLFDHIPTVINPLHTAAIIAAAFGLSIFFAAVPAWRAARLTPMDSIRYE